jgi:hypothetical protein
MLLNYLTTGTLYLTYSLKAEHILNITPYRHTSVLNYAREGENVKSGVVLLEISEYHQKTD